MKKKFLTASVVLILLTLTACGTKNSESKDSTNRENKTIKSANKKTDKQKDNTTVKPKTDNSSDTKQDNSNLTSTESSNTSNSVANDTNQATTTPTKQDKIDSADQAASFIKSQLGYTNNNDISAGTAVETENGQPVYTVQLKSISSVVKNGAGGTIGYYKVYPNGQWSQM